MTIPRIIILDVWSFEGVVGLVLPNARSARSVVLKENVLSFMIERIYFLYHTSTITEYTDII